MIIMKFGGSATENSDLIKNTVSILKNHLDYQPVVVASATGLTTRNLLSIARYAANDNIEKTLKLLKEKIIDYHLGLIKPFHNLHGYSNLLKKIDTYHSEITSDLEMIEGRRELSPFLQDKVLSYGELLSTSILEFVMRGNGIPVELLDARHFIITDNYFTHASPVKEKTYEEINLHVKPLINKGIVPLTQGFIGATIFGEATTLGFEGSDYSAVLIGAALDATEIQIWKNVDGILSADPTSIPETKTVKNMSFAEVAELTRCGAKILHPETVKPAREKNISIKLCNFKNPGGSFTIINNYSTPQFRFGIKSVTYREKLCLLKIQSKELTAQIDFLAKVFSIIKDAEVIPLHIRGTNNRLDLIINVDGQFLEKELQSIAYTFVECDKATVSLIGNTKNLSSEITGILDKQKIHSISIDETAAESCTFLIDQKHLKKSLLSLHEHFFKE